MNENESLRVYEIARLVNDFLELTDPRYATYYDCTKMGNYKNFELQLLKNIKEIATLEIKRLEEEN